MHGQHAGSVPGASNRCLSHATSVSCRGRSEQAWPHTGMATTTLSEFLRARRERLSPESTERRRTPGLRREEVAARAGVSVTWYTWLEQGRGGVPSDDVLERLSRALELDETNREMLFLLAH